MNLLKMQFAIVMTFFMAARGHAAITESEVSAVQGELASIFASDISDRHLTLAFENLYDSDITNAYTRIIGSRLLLSAQGGILNNPDLDQDTLAAVHCHQLGNVLGGAPKLLGSTLYVPPMQSDYFATAKCLKRLFASRKDSQIVILTLNIPVTVTVACDRIFDSEDSAICKRTAVVSRKLMKLVVDIRREGENIDFSTPDLNKVEETIMHYGSVQCRLDTLFQGALCSVDPTQAVSDSDPAVGYCVRSGNGETVGARPQCWFK